MPLRFDSDLEIVAGKGNKKVHKEPFAVITRLRSVVVQTWQMKYTQ